MKTISEDALVKRINRKLAQEGLQLRKSRPDSRWMTSLGAYYIVNIDTNGVEESDVPLGDLACHLQVLGNNERVEL